MPEDDHFQKNFYMNEVEIFNAAYEQTGMHNVSNRNTRLFTNLELDTQEEDPWNKGNIHRNNQGPDLEQLNDFSNVIDTKFQIAASNLQA